MKTTAAILVETGKPLELGLLEIPALKPGQVLVRISHSGVCHTQLLECRGHRGVDKFLPHALGHEGSGVVEDVGSAVVKVKAGDRVVLSWMKGRGADVPGTVYKWDRRSVNAGAITTFAQHAVISENRLTVLPSSFALPLAALLGCAVPTGMGALLNTAGASAKQSVVVFGVGGVGLCSLAAAIATRCSPVIAVDVLPQKLARARDFGVLDTIDASNGDPLVKILELCPAGVDIAIEATGQPVVMRQALQAVRARGGKAVIVGNAKFGSRLEIDPHQFNQGKQMLGSWGGDNNPDVDFPKYIALLESGGVNLSALQANIYTLADINEALDDLESGKALRPLVRME
jgi:S-(hydroxymethyl)glutathione dehydrogenase/alcohol dehydrogenase